jgi:hypothetical protein
MYDKNGRNTPLIQDVSIEVRIDVAAADYNVSFAPVSSQSRDIMYCPTTSAMAAGIVGTSPRITRTVAATYMQCDSCVR